MLDYLIDPRDQAVLGAVPTLMQPLHGTLEPCPLFTHRFVIARDGVYLQARTPALDVCLQVAAAQCCAFPYGTLTEHCRLAGGPIPWRLFESIRRMAQAASPDEWACQILHDPDEGYRIHVPRVISCTAGHITYATDSFDPEQVVVDLHTHGEGEAFFSATDDESDRQGGIYIAVVLGRCGPHQHMTQATRLVVNGLLLNVELGLWRPA